MSEETECRGKPFVLLDPSGREIKRYWNRYAAKKRRDELGSDFEVYSALERRTIYSRLMD